MKYKFVVIIKPNYRYKSYEQIFEIMLNFYSSNSGYSTIIIAYSNVIFGITSIVLKIKFTHIDKIFLKQYKIDIARR